MNWAKDIGDDVLLWVKAQLAQKQHEEQAYRVCLGLLNLSRSYPADRLNNACAIANQYSLYRLKHIKDILSSLFKGFIRHISFITLLKLISLKEGNTDIISRD